MTSDNEIVEKLLQINEYSVELQLVGANHRFLLVFENFTISKEHL